MPWAVQFKDTNVDKFVIVKAITGHDMYFWHTFSGCPGSMNDTNVMGVSTLS